MSCLDGPFTPTTPLCAAVVDGEIKDVKLSDYKGKYVILFWYPKDFTFVCPTEIIAFSDRAKEFEALNTQVHARGTCGRGSGAGTWCSGSVHARSHC